ncbi:response regulator transcription factor [Sulfurimonas sp.]|uniref:response regulator transcription factor n=1 Tax=Sulfurimonas sp. TaxID=2022749 RepID=UPI0039E6CEC5
MSHKEVSILIAEDDKELRELYVEYLELFFSKVYQAKDGLEAFDIYKKESPNIIISDIGMPRLDGLSLIQRIRKQDKKTLILILSAYTDKEVLLEAVKLHLFEYLVKPIKSHELKDTILKMIKSIESDDTCIKMSDGYRWVKESQQLYSKKIHIELKESEKKLLEILLKSLNSNVSCESIYQYVYHDLPDKEYSLNSVTSLVKRLRKKLPQGTISTNYGSGYRLNIY